MDSPLWNEYLRLTNSQFALRLPENVKRLITIGRQLIDQANSGGDSLRTQEGYELKQQIKQLNYNLIEITDVRQLEIHFNGIQVNDRLQQVKQQLFLQLRARIIASKIQQYQDHQSTPVTSQNFIQQNIQQSSRERPRRVVDDTITSIVEDLDPPDSKYPEEGIDIPIGRTRFMQQGIQSAMRASRNRQQQPVVFNLPGQATTLIMQPVTDPQAVANRYGYYGILPKVQKNTMKCLRLLPNVFLFITRKARDLNDAFPVPTAWIVISFVGAFAWEFAIPEVLAFHNRFGALLVANAAAVSQSYPDRERRNMLIMTSTTIIGTGTAYRYPGYISALIALLTFGYALYRRHNAPQGQQSPPHRNNNNGGSTSITEAPHPASIILPLITEEDGIEDVLEYIKQDDIIELSVENDLIPATASLQIQSQSSSIDDDLHLGEEEDLDLDQKYSEPNALVQVLTPSQQTVTSTPTAQIFKLNEIDSLPIYVSAFNWGQEYVSSAEDEKSIRVPRMQTFTSITSVVDNDNKDESEELIREVCHEYMNPTGLLQTAVQQGIESTQSAVSTVVTSASENPPVAATVALSTFLISYLTNRGINRLFRSPVVTAVPNLEGVNPLIQQGLLEIQEMEQDRRFHRIMEPIVSHAVKTTFKLEPPQGKLKKKESIGRKQLKSIKQQANETEEDEAIQTNTVLMMCKMMSISLRYSTPVTNQLDVLALQVVINQLFQTR